MKYEILVVCCDCKRLIAVKESLTPMPGQSRCSHSYCPKCHKKALDQITHVKERRIRWNKQ